MFAYGLLSAWNLLPHMAGEYRKTKLAFQIRGIRVLPFSPRLLVTLMVKTVRWSEDLAMAMESRGFSSKQLRSSYEPPQIHKRDIAFLIVTCAIFPTCAFLITHWEKVLSRFCTRVLLTLWFWLNSGKQGSVSKQFLVFKTQIQQNITLLVYVIRGVIDKRKQVEIVC